MMTPEPTRDSQRPADPVPYELAFVVGSNPGAEVVRADLTSPLLDRAMHPSGAQRVLFAARPHRSGNEGGFALTAFQIDSLAEYVRS